MAQVQSSIARAFFKAEEERGVTAKTYNNTLIFLRAIFHALRKDAGLPENPFEAIPTREGETVFRKPFTAEELALIVEKAEADLFIQPLIIWSTASVVCSKDAGGAGGAAPPLGL